MTQDSERGAGILLPAFSATREGDAGIGDTRGVREWIDLLARHGFKILQLLPVNETGSDDSPYECISSLALDPIYLALEDVPGAEATSAPRTRLVDYPAVRQRKHKALEAAWGKWSEAGVEWQREFQEFCAQEAEWLDDYTAFRVLMERAGGECWEQWPEEWQDPVRAREVARETADRGRYFQWLQWLTHRQWRAVSEHARERGVSLMGDVPIGISRNSADVFFRREDFDLHWNGGAPPETVFKYDEFIRKWGQNWGLPLYRWAKMQRENFPWWRRRITKLTEIFKLFRIDHVLGFYRIYAFPWPPARNAEFLALDGGQAAELLGGELPRWVPRPDDYETNCQANQAEGERRLRMILEAANGAGVIGEDLGSVPEYVRPSLARLGIAGFRIPHWDHDEQGTVIPGDEFPECSLATYATHDHDPLPAQWQELRRQAEDTDLDEEERKSARDTWQRLAAFAGMKASGGYEERVFHALARALLASRSRYAIFMITELCGMTERINRPGVVGPENWSFRMPETAAECGERPEWERLARLIDETGRSRPVSGHAQSLPIPHADNGAGLRPG